MSKKTFCLLILFTVVSVLLKAEDPLIIRENTNFAWMSNNVGLDDGVVSVWSDTKTSIWNLYVQKVDTAGNQLWNSGQPLLIDGTPITYANYHCIIKTSDNCIIITWIRFEGPDSYKMFAQKFSSSGQILWSQGNELIAETTSYPCPYLVANEVGGTYIIYYNNDDDEIDGINLDANANDLWSANSDPLFTNCYIEDVVSDNYGGLIINYSDQIVIENLKVARINSNGEILWDSLISTLELYYYNSDMISVGSNDFITWWRDGNTIMGQRVDVNGNTYWGENGIPINNQPIYEYSEVDLIGNDNSFFMTYTIETPPPSNYQIFKILKIDLDGNALWNNGTALSNSDCYYVDLCTNANQECFISWYKNGFIYAQKVDTNGNKLWGDDGITVGSGIGFEWTQGGLQLNQLNEQLLCMWQPIQNLRSSLRYQALDAYGNLLLPGEGVDIQSGIQSNIFDYLLIGNDDSSYYLWEGVRYGHMRLFAQRVSPNGTNYFPEFGITITDTAYYHQRFFVAKALPEGGIAVAWSEVRENEELIRVRWQILNPDGTVLSHIGFNVTADVNYDQIHPKIDIVNGNIIIIWLEEDQLKAQKLINYSPIWGSNGSLLIESIDNEYVTLTGSYICFEYQDEYYFNRIDENGNISAGWPFPGVAITTSRNNIKTMDEFNGDLVYTWRDSHSGLEDYGFQILTSAGEYVFPNNGFNLLTNVNFYNYNFLFDGYINLFHEEETGYNILMERYDLQGNMIWNGTTCFIQNSNSFNKLNSTKMGDNFLVTWCTSFNVNTNSYMMQMIDADGNPIPTNLTIDEFEVYSDQSEYQLASVTDTDVALLFHRGYNVSSETTFFSSGLVSYLINSSDVPITEDEIVFTTKCNLSNYPNPFNPTTTINYSLKENSKVSINIYNIKGQKVKQLVSDQFPAGQHSVVWDGRDSYDKQVSSGIYFYKLKVNGKDKTVRKCLLLK